MTIDSTVDIPPEVLNLLEKIKTKHYNEGLVINEHNRSTWLTAFSIVLLPNSKNLAKYLPSLLRTYGSLPENDHTVVPASQILIAMTKSIESKSIPTIEIFTLIQEIMTKRLSHERSLQTIQNKEEISNLLLPELRKAARNATDDAIDSKLDNAFEELKKSISLYKQLVDNFELVLEMEQVHQNFWEKWSNKPSISWLLELPFQEARDFEDNYQSLDDYIRSMKETWLMMTFYWGAAACSPRCCFKSQDNKACGEPLIHGASKGKDRKPQLCSQRIRVNNESGSCNASAEWGCFRKGHDLFCKDCLREKQFKICRSTQGKDSSTDIYDCNITTSTIVGESLLLHCNELLSRHPPSAEFPINWRTTYRLQQAQLVAVIPKVVRCMALDSTDKIYWGEIICPQSKSGNSDDESTRRKKGQISIRLLGKQDCDLLEDFGLIAGDSQFRSKATIAIIDLRVFVPEVISVLATMSSNEFVKGLQHANFKPLLLNSVSAPMENIPTGVPLRNMIFYGLQHSTIATVRLLSNELINNLTDELWKINQIRSLDDTQGKSFAMALMHSLHTCQGPPGSGKSFVGVCLVLALSKIRQFVKHKLGSSLGPIIVLAYKNHALDEFLVDVLRADVMLMKEKGRLIRLGKPDEEMLLEFTETRNRMEFEAQKELENRLEIIKRVKTEIKNIAGAMMSEYVEAEKYFRCLSLYSLIDSTREPTPTEAFDNLVDFCRNDLLWTETIDAFGSELLLSTEHIQIDKLRKVAAVDCTEKESLHKFKVMWGKWLRGESIPPRCILNVPVKKGKRNKQQEDTMIQCFNCASESSQFCAEIHRCLFKNRINDTEVCCGKSRIDLDKMLYCEIHVCDDEDCLNSKSLQGSYCNSHSCSICFEFKQSSKHSCTEHKCSHCDKVVLSKSNGDCFKFCSDHSCSVCISESILDGKCNIAPNAGIACKLHACSLYPTCENIKHPGLEFCFNHLCKHCLEPVTDESHYCLEHKCTEENCHDAKAIVRTAEDEVFLCGYCANHSCLVCATLFAQGQIESIFLATSSRQTCDHHFLCPGMLPSGEDCCAIVDGGNEYCATHSFDLVNTCRGITSKNVNCRSIAISGTGYCKDHQQQKPPASANSFMCEEKSKLFLNLPPAANTIIASVNTEKKPPFKKCNERHCDAQCLLLHPMDSWLCNLHATAQENTASLESLAVETIAAEPVMPILPSNQEFTANSKIPPKERCVKRILLDSDDEDVPAPANDMKYFNGSANPDEMDYNEESEQFEDDMEAGAVEHNREIYQEEVDELEGMGIEEEDDGDHLENDNRTTDYEFNVHRFDDVDSAADYIDTLNNLSNFDWDLSSQDRLNLVNRYFSMSIQYLRLILRYADKHVDEARRMRAEASGAALKKAAIIGGTIVGAAKRLSALRAAEPFAVIVEEACEVLEPTLISVLSVSSLQKLELIGDHRQLPAFVNQYWYNIEMIRPKIKKSLFERIVLGVGEYANHPVCTILNMQRRMRTSISALTKTEYADIVQLIDHKCTAIQKIGDRYSGEDNIEGIQKLWATSGRSVPGIQSNIFFWDLQDNKESKASVGLSACNENEADAVTKLVKYLHQSCLVPLECITIITPYQGQKRQLVKSLRLEKLLPGAMHNNKPPTETKNNKSSGKNFVNLAIKDLKSKINTVSKTV